MKKFLFFLILLLISVFVGASGFLFYLIFVAPGDHLDLNRIKKSVLTESTVYYRDGQTKLGAFYNDVHRDYLVIPNQMTISTNPDDVIPPLFLKAIVASEDQNFYNHIGVSILGIFRAAIANLRAGKVVQGGSTLTQQTAELLFEHKAKDKWEKWKEKALETLDAFRMEVRYSKDQILEFYSNLFHVHGTGQGLAIAARYYFDKSVSELNLPELAFIAGSVKGPANYNPFRTKDPEKIKAIVKRATSRRDYVLNNMHISGAISAEELEESKKFPVDFHQGDFRFEESHQMNAVWEALKAEPWKSKLKENGILDLKQAEINIYTTLDHELQKVGEFALKRHLSRLESRIKKYVEPVAPPVSEKTKPEAKKFYVGTITQIIEKPSRKILIKIGADQGVVEEKHLEEFVRSALQLKRKTNASHYKQAFKLLKIGSPVLISTQTRKPDGRWILAIEQEPQLNGGVFILQEGEVRGMIGGYHDYGFNRALQARRQPGSTFKLPVYLAALQLGWDPLEPLPNEPRIYPFQSQFYFPRPDHQPKDRVSSMVWAGAKSENLASIYLMVHLLDHLDLQSFEEIMRLNGLVQQDHESIKEYQIRLRDKLGILDTEKHLMPGIFGRVQKRLKNELLFDSNSEESLMWDRLFYGQGWEKAYKARRKYKNRQKVLERLELRNNFLRFQESAETALQRTAPLASTFVNEDPLPLSQMDEKLLNGFFIQAQMVGKAKVPPLSYALPGTQMPKEWKPLKRQNLILYRRFWGKKLRQALFRPDNIWINGKIRVSLLNTANDLMGQLLEETKQFKPYTAERLYFHHDFRVMLALKTVILLSEVLGVRSELKPVLSFPLGSNEISLDELALMYQTYVSGEINFREEGPKQNGWKLIDRIEDARGNILYQNRTIRKRIIPENTAHSLREILRTVVEYGTGRGSKPSLEMDVIAEGPVSTIRIPAYGKTGTANNYSNATYAGFLPVIQGGLVSMRGGYTITTYVGLDRQEEKKDPLPFKLTGHTGGVPVWSEIAHHIIQTPAYQNKLDWSQIPELKTGEVLPIPNPENYRQEVSSITGLAISEEDLPSSENSAHVFLPAVDLKNSRKALLFREIDQLKNN
ncbi:MAG: transglycosylase domain-containing protein [SAR324 cluster bacterium]|nr:transglycosylase domain-containing protein [SAR324 cluster bacterium]